MTEVKDVAGELKPDSLGKAAEATDAVGKSAVGDIPVVGSGAKLVGKEFGVINSIKECAKGGAGSPDVADVAMSSASFLADAGSTAADWSSQIQSAAEDPLGWLISNGLNFLIDAIHPIKEALETVSGDSASINGAADKFSKIGDGFEELSENLKDVGDERLANWRGKAADAARKELAGFADGVAANSAKCAELSKCLTGSGMVMDMIEELIKSLLSALVEWLLMLWLPALAASVFTLGGSDAAAATATGVKLVEEGEKVASEGSKLMRILGKLMKFFGKLMEKSGSKIEKEAAGVAEKAASKAGKKAAENAAEDGLTKASKEAGERAGARALEGEAKKAGEDAATNAAKHGASRQAVNAAGRQAHSAAVREARSNAEKAATVSPGRMLKHRLGEATKDSLTKSVTGADRGQLSGEKPGGASGVVGKTLDYAQKMKHGVEANSTIAEHGQSDTQTSSELNVDDPSSGTSPAFAQTPQQQTYPHHVTDWSEEEEYPHQSVFDDV